MIHITDFNGDIIDFISKSDGAVTEAEHMINVEDKLETFDFTVLTSRTEHMQKRNRVIIEDKDGQYREFIIYNISSDLNGYTRVQTNSSALEDIKTAKPVAPHKLNKYTVKQALEYALADTGWEVSDEAEWGGTRTTSWTGWHDRISILKQLETTYGMRLSFHVEVGSNKITNRYVSLNKVEPMFNGEEIVYGDNMINLKRTVDFSDIATALICLGPEDSETGKREIVEVKDDDAQAQFGLPYRYIWDIYEPQSSDEKMTKERLTTLGRTALNKRKQESISYEIDGIGLSASAGDMIRVKNEDFTPELYVDAEVVEVTTDLISGESTYKFGVIKEYTRDDVYARFNAMLSGLRERLNKVVENTDSIISERLEEALKYVERYIEKSPTPPLNPEEGQLWLDTSHDGVAVLKRYENGEWIKSSVDDVKDIGGMTREETMFEALKERSVRNEVDYSEVFKRHGALVSEKHYHYVDEDTKNDLTNRYNSLQQSYDDFKQAFNNINAEQPTIGLITTAISRAIEFEARLKEYNDSYYVARKSFDEVIGVLQSQYSEEKYNDAMQELAEQIGGEWNGNELIVDGKVHEKFYDVRNELERQDNLLKNTIDETEYISGELSKSQSAIEQHSYELNTKVSYTEMNGTQQTLEKLLTEFSQTADGFNFRVDSNGMIQDLTFDRNGFKLNSNLIEFNDGDVVIKDGVTTIKDAYIDKLFSKTAFIENLKAVDIDFNKATARAENGSDYINITGSRLELGGRYSWNWRGGTKNYNSNIVFENGYMRVTDRDINQHLYYTQKGISTFNDGNVDESSGTLEFFSYDYHDIRKGVTLSSTGGAVALRSALERAIIDAHDDVYLMSEKQRVKLQPRKELSGNNTFEFHIIDNEGVALQDGMIYYGSENNPYSSVGLRFSKELDKNTLYVTNGSGRRGTGDLEVRKLRVNENIIGTVNLDHVKTGDIIFGSLRTLNTSTNTYFGVGSAELRITNNQMYNGGNTVYRPIRASAFNQGSSLFYKTNIKNIENIGLSVVRDLTVVEYDLIEDIKNGIENRKQVGFIAEYSNSIATIDNKAIDIYRLSAYNTKAIQELAHENDELKKRIEKLEELING